MLADAVYDALRPFHLWAQVAAVCAVALAAAAVVVLALSRRWSRRWWLGMGVLSLCLLAVAFGERSRSAAGDLRTGAVCYVQWLAGCDVWTQWLAEATRSVSQLGAMVLVATILGLVVAAAVLLAERRRWLSGGWRPPARVRSLTLAVALAAFGAYLAADGVAAWIRYAYLADISAAGDGLGQLPLIDGIFGTILGLLVLAAGIAFVVAASPSRRAPEAANRVQ